MKTYSVILIDETPQWFIKQVGYCGTGGNGRIKQRRKEIDKNYYSNFIRDIKYKNL